MIPNQFFTKTVGMFKTKTEKRAFLKQSIKMAELETKKLDKQYHLEMNGNKRLQMAKTIQANDRSIKHLKKLLTLV